MSDEDYAAQMIMKQRDRGAELGRKWAAEQTEPLTQEAIFEASARLFPQEVEDFIAAYNVSAGFEEAAMSIMREQTP